MQFSTQICSGSIPFKPATNMSYSINMAQHGSKINPKTIARRLEVNQSKKNPYLLKRRPSSNFRTLLLGPRSSDRRNANFLFSLFLLLPSFFSFPLSFFLLFPSFLSLSFFSFLSFLSVLLSTYCDLPLLIHTSNP